MVKIYQDSIDKRKKQISVAFHSKKHFFDILERVKRHPCKREKRIWKVALTSLMDLLEDLDEIRQENVHMAFGIFKYFFAERKYFKELLKLRNSLQDIDCGVKLQNNFKLLPFQEVGVEFIHRVKHGIIADKVCLGKTVQALATTYKMWDWGEIEKVFVIVPSTIKRKWQNDTKKFFNIKAKILEGMPEVRKRIFQDFMNGDDIYLILSYDILRRDFDGYIKNFTPKLYAIVFDETQKLKNPNSQRSKYCKLFAENKYCMSRIGLSATYVETGLYDLFGAMLVINENIFGTSFTGFANKYLKLDFWGKVIGAKENGIIDARNKMKYWSVRRRKPEVSDQLEALLPKMNEDTLWIEFSKPEKELYNQILDRVEDNLNNMEKARQVTSANAMTETGLLLQSCLSTEMFDYKEIVSSKINTLLEILPEIIEENKVVIFCHYVRFVDITERELKNAGISCLAMHGQRREGKVKNRQDMIDKFSDSDIPVLITSDILSEGVDIPAASYVINMDILWNPAKMTQRAGRIDRLNQKAANIYVLNLLTVGTIEEGMNDVVYDRYNLALNVMDDGVEEDRIKRLTFKDIKKLLRRV
jgi:SNF2 family DNA or RNA helicase